jgi:hypothetical protein
MSLETQEAKDVCGPLARMIAEAIAVSTRNRFPQT